MEQETDECVDGQRFDRLAIYHRCAGRRIPFGMQTGHLSQLRLYAGSRPILAQWPRGVPPDGLAARASSYAHGMERHHRRSARRRTRRGLTGRTVRSQAPPHPPQGMRDGQRWPVRRAAAARAGWHTRARCAAMRRLRCCTTGWGGMQDAAIWHRTLRMRGLCAAQKTTCRPWNGTEVRP